MFRPTLVLVVASVLLAVSVAATSRNPVESGADIRWLSRVGFGLDARTLARYRIVGREKYLDEQLHPPPDNPAPIEAAIAALPISSQSAAERTKATRAEQQRINSLSSEDEKQQARRALNQAGNEVAYQTMRRHLMRAVESPWQLREAMTWFWMNHFSVFQGKANVRWTMSAHEDEIRTHALGRFSDLVLATVTSPSMLEYLDNAQSAVGKVNENYARELLELHTLGVSGGWSGSRYTQMDVQELARILTGVGLNFTDREPTLRRDWQPLYVHRGLFEFNPARHDVEAKRLLGVSFSGHEGFSEVERAVAMICREPATARFISGKLARYFVADDPPPALVARVTTTFQKSDGSIADVLRALFLDKDLLADLSTRTPQLQKFKDPMQFVVSSLRLAYDGKSLSNYRPVTGWLQQLGEPLYGRVTPDGYPATEAAWTSPGQMIRRFEIARAIGSGNAGLFNRDDGKPGPQTGFPLVATRVFYDALEPRLGAQTRVALNNAASQQEWNTLFLGSPDWMFR